MLRIEIHEYAACEFDEAIEWYDSKLNGLGNRFKQAVKKQINQASKNPSWYPKENSDISKIYIPKFPYKVLFTFNDKAMTIWAIAHLHRKPEYWQSRF